MTQSQEDGTVESEVEFVGTNDNDVEVSIYYTSCING